MDDIVADHKKMKKDLEKLESDLRKLTQRAADKQKEGPMRQSRRDLMKNIDDLEIKMKELRAMKHNGFVQKDRKELLKRQISELEIMEAELLG